MPDNRSAPARDSADNHWTRRSFLVGAGSLGVTTTLGVGTFVTENGKVAIDPWLRDEGGDSSPIIPTADVSRRWLGPELWGNRLQDWKFTDGRVECLRGQAGYELRTVGVLTRELVAENEPGHIRVRAGIAEGALEQGFCGLLIGIGNGELDYRAAALAGRSSGIGGGLLCTYETDGEVRIREHTDEENPVAYRELPSDALFTKTTADRSAFRNEIRLAVDVLPQGDDRFAIQVKAFEAESGEALAGAVRYGVPERKLLGGIALVSSPLPGRDGPRWWFERLRTSGGKIAKRPEHTFGPIAGTLYSVTDSKLKLSAHLLPIGQSDSKTVRLRYRPEGSAASWRTARTEIGPGYTAQFRIDDWDSTQAWDYRVAYEDSTGQEWQYDGRIDADPGGTGELVIGLLSCMEVCVRHLDREKTPSDYSQTSIPGRYTPGNITFPYETLTQNIETHDPDLLVCVGDQVYENKPTEAPGRDDPELDYLYKWYLWLWSVRNLTRNTPTIVLVDDHDVYQPMLWGSGGDRTSMGNLRDGGYVGSVEFVNRIQHIQCGHNPDPYDPTPTEGGISVYYGAFTYGGTSFAMLEDRKFKTGPNETESRTEREAELLGERQEEFVEAWAANADGVAATVCLTQTCFAAPLTISGGQPATPEEAPKSSFETNGFPKEGRDRAVELLRDAGALVLAGDLHLPMLLRHGLETHTDGVVQFVGPGGSAPFVRWFDPAEPLPNGREYPNTGTFTDAFGNKVRMLAVKNPDVSAETFEREYTGIHLHDREKRSDGYGVVRVNHEDEVFVIECWPWFVDPTADDAEQFPGWPYRLSFDETARGSR